MAPASEAPPSGEASMPSSVCRSLAAAARSPSVTATAPPPLSRNARSIRRSPSGAGTRSPAAIVWGFGHGAQDSAPASNPFTTGAHPAAWTLYSRGGVPSSQPARTSSWNAFHMPIRPVPPPVGYRSEEHTSELQSRLHLVCRLLLEKKKKKKETTQLSHHDKHSVRL